MTKSLVVVSCLLLTVYFSMTAALYFFQRTFLYAPTPNITHNFEHFTVSNEGETIDIVVLNKGKPESILYFGGNGEIVLNSADEFIKHFPNKTVYLVNYRGYGASSGSPTEQALYSDAIKIFETVKNNHQTVSIIGRSLGSGVTTYLAANKSVNKIALITPYDSILNIAKKRFKIFPVRYLLEDKFDSVSRAKKIRSEVLILAAENDQVIPTQNTKNLADEFNQNQLTYVEIKGEGHNSVSRNRKYFEILKEFFND